MVDTELIELRFYVPLDTK